MWRLLLAVVLLGAVRSASAEYQMIGAGLLSCGSWTTNRREDRTRVVWLSELEWVEGFLSDVGYAGNGNGFDPLRGLGDRGVAAWLDSYCHAYPLKPLAEAAAALVDKHPH